MRLPHNESYPLLFRQEEEQRAGLGMPWSCRLFPSDLEVGQRLDLDALARRLARHHFVGTARAFASSCEPKHMDSARIRGEVIRRTGVASHAPADQTRPLPSSAACQLACGAGVVAAISTRFLR